MAEDAWAKASNKFTSAVHEAIAEGMSEDEVRNALDDALDNLED